MYNLVLLWCGFLDWCDVVRESGGGEERGGEERRGLEGRGEEESG